MVDQGIKLYLQEVTIHIDDCIQELDKLSELYLLGKRDYLIAERLLQMLTEAAIGLAKHWLKGMGKQTGTSAYQSFQKLTDCEVIDKDELLRWKKIIGLRNALVHDYLNLDREIVRKVVTTQEYKYLQAFSLRAVEALKAL